MTTAIQLLKRSTGHDLVLEWMRFVSATVARTSPDAYTDFAWKVHYPALHAAIKGSGMQLGSSSHGMLNLAAGSSAAPKDVIHRGTAMAVQPAQLPYAKKELCASEISVHMSVLPSIMLSRPAMVAPFPAILEEIKSSVITELGAYRAAIAKERHNAGADVAIQPLLSACRKGTIMMRSKVAKPLEQQRVLWRGVAESALAFGWCHEDGEVRGKSFVLQVLASKNPDYAEKYSNTSELAAMGDESSSFRRRRGVADKEMVCGFKAEFSPVMNEVHERQQLKRFKKLLGRLSDQRIGDMLKTDEDAVQSLKGIHIQLSKHHVRLRAIYRYYCRLGSNTLPGESPVNHIGNVSACMHPDISYMYILINFLEGEFYQLVSRVQVCGQESPNCVFGHRVQEVQLGNQWCAALACPTCKSIR